MTSKLTKIAIAITVTLVVLAIAATVGEFYQNTPSVPKPFTLCLSTHPNNGTVLQAQNLTITVDVTYLEGTPEPVTLSATGGPNGTIFQFSNQTGTPNATQPFSSYLTILLPATAASDTYAINISSTPGAKTSQATLNLTVINSQIQVSGAVTGTAMPLAGHASEDIIPTEIVFESTKTNQTYQAKVYRSTDTPQRPGTVGNYTILLPNWQSYRVTIYYFSFPHYVPVARAAYESNQKGPFTVDCGVGVDAITADFKG